MPEWCPKCHALLSPDQAKCPVCGARLPKSSKSDFTKKDILTFSLFFLGLALIPILFAIGVGLICVFINR